MDLAINDIRSRIMCHRGYWSGELGIAPLQKNSWEAFERAIDFGFGIETDLRDYAGSIVISHDVPTDQNSSRFVGFAKFLELNFPGTVALNIKSDGLANLLSVFNPRLSLIDHFFFDLSIPELLQYQACELNTAIRISEYESMDLLTAQYVWIDSFGQGHWNRKNLSQLLLNSSMQFVFVSPELHGFDPVDMWNEIGPLFLDCPNLRICTDFPREFQNSLPK
jgi:hypothetical protein